MGVPLWYVVFLHSRRFVNTICPRMKHLIISACLVAMSTAKADEIITKAEAQSLRTLSVIEIEANAPDLEGAVIRVKFTHRALAINKDGRVSRGSLEMYQNTAGYGSVPVTVPPQGIIWFTRLPSNIMTTHPQFIIGRVRTGRFGPEIELLGNNITNSFTESKVVWR